MVVKTSQLSRPPWPGQDLNVVTIYWDPIAKVFRDQETNVIIAAKDQNMMMHDYPVPPRAAPKNNSRLKWTNQDWMKVYGLVCEAYYASYRKGALASTYEQSNLNELKKKLEHMFREEDNA